MCVRIAAGLDNDDDELLLLLLAYIPLLSSVCELNSNDDSKLDISLIIVGSLYDTYLLYQVACHNHSYKTAQKQGSTSSTRRVQQQQSVSPEHGL